jgi:hypothetical protein
MPRSAFTATRLGAKPILNPGSHSSLGDNLNGPSLIRAPPWVEAPLGRYYLYFAHHQGRSIRLAVADDLAGPWRVYPPGALSLEASLFEADITPGTAAPPEGFAGDPEDHHSHIASPDVHVDAESRTVRMYYHGLLRNGDQATRVAVSRDGVAFEARAPLLGPAYFRVFDWRGMWYALGWGGEILRAPAWDAPFEPGPVVVPVLDGRRLRHGAVLLDGDRLHVFHSRIGDRPERILHCEIALTDDWRAWRAGEDATVLTPEWAWEGADLPPTVSLIGMARDRVHALRDPAVFTDDDGKRYLLYSGAGEAGIGIARLDAVG